MTATAAHGERHVRTVRGEMLPSADARRDEKLRRAGYRVLRIPAEVVMRELPVALRRIREVLVAG